MDPNRGNYNLKPQFSQPPPSPSSSSSSANFPILALSILGILTTSILLLSYYIFVIKCCLNLRRPDILRHLPYSRRSRHAPMRAYSRPVERHGLEESAIRAIPTFRYSRGGGGGAEQRSFHECAVCLNEFQEEERIRLLPNCLHVFHIDCIDTWLQSNANCPLCRSNITAISRASTDHFLVTTHQQNLPHQDRDIVIEIIDESTQENQPVTSSSSNSPAKNSEQGIEHKKRRKIHHMSSMGDECINVRAKDEQFSVQTMRRSFSMDSSSDRQLYMAVQKILQQNLHFQEIGLGESSNSSIIAGSSSSGRVRRSFFSFSHHRSLRTAVLPIQNEL